MDGGVMGTRSVALLMTDVVGSTRWWAEAPVAMNAAMALHHALIGEVVAGFGGRFPVDQGEGDSRFAAFESTAAAVAAGVRAQRSLASATWPEPVRLEVRMAVHVGDVIERDGNLYGDSVNRCARLRSVGHGGQLLLSDAVREQLVSGGPPSVAVLDHGLHRLKDLAEPVRVWQALHPDLPTDFPPLASLDRVRHNLPVQLSSFVGRHELIADLVKRVRDQQLVTLVGFGGMGKTRTALEVAAELADDFADGVFFVDLSGVTDPDDVASAVSRAAGLQGSSPTVEGLCVTLASLDILLVLDNLEQLLPAVASRVAAFVASGPSVRVLATSREPIGVRGESVVAVTPMDRPTSSSVTEIDSFESVRLFVARAQAADASFALDEQSAPAVAAICDLLEGWPLALELAAGRLRLLGPTLLLARLQQGFGLLASGPRDLPGRQRTLTDTIAWSYELLGPDEQSLLRALSIFPSSGSLEAIEQVWQPDGACATIDVLAGLVDKCLVQPVAGTTTRRFRLLEAIRHFAAEKLGQGDERRLLLGRYQRHYRELFKDDESGPGIGDCFRDEIPDVLHVLGMLSVGDPRGAVDLLVAVEERLSFSDGTEQVAALARALGSEESLQPAHRYALAAVLHLHAYVATGGGPAPWDVRVVEWSGAIDFLLRPGPFARVAVRSLQYLAAECADRGDGELGQIWATRGVGFADTHLGPTDQAWTRAVLGYAMLRAGCAGEALALAREALALGGDRPALLAHEQTLQCWALLELDDVPGAIAAGLEAERAAEDLGVYYQQWCGAALSRAYTARGQTFLARQRHIRFARLARLGPAFVDASGMVPAFALTHPELAAALLGMADALEESGRGPHPPRQLSDLRGALIAGYQAQYRRGRDGTPRELLLQVAALDPDG